MAVNKFKKILITQSELINYAGSEIVTLELAEYFSQNDFEVDILTNFIDKPIANDFNRLENIKIHTDYINLDISNYDLIWIHHQFIPFKLIDAIQQGIKLPKVVFHHMSPFHNLEFPFSGVIEEQLADLILYNSLETKRSIEDRLPKLTLNGDVFNNPAPDAFVSTRDKYHEQLKHLLIVSSHVPDELREAAQELARKGVEIKILGDSKHDEFRRVTPEDIGWADAVVTIGKTVQYSLVGGVPVYCYDHFGGPGYLTKGNFQKASDLNFSGRGFRKKSSDLITQELIEGYSQAVSFSKQLPTDIKEQYILSKRVKDVLAVLYKSKKNKPAIDEIELVKYKAYSKHMWDVHHKLCLSIQQQIVDNQEYESILDKLLDDNKQILESNSWKVTKPLRMLSDIFNRTKRDK